MQRCVKPVQNHAPLCQYFMVPEPQDAETLLFQPGGAPGICDAVAMLAAIGFDDQSGVVAEEIGDERADGNLPAKLEGAEPPIAQHRPELAFGLGRLPAHGAGAGLQGRCPLTLLGWRRVALSREGRG
jgi:hypothetical protein